MQDWLPRRHGQRKWQSKVARDLEENHSQEAIVSKQMADDEWEEEYSENTTVEM